VKRTGRREEVALHCDEIAVAGNLPKDWVWNMLETQTLIVLDRSRNYRVQFGDGLALVPSTFGQVHVDPRLD
jgi:hypothetical protein